MKRLILFALVLFCCMYSAYPEKYHPMVKESNHWNMLSVGYGAWYAIISKNTSYKIEGDTSIQSVDYKKVYSSTDSLNQIWTIYALLREDTLQKKVWLRKDDVEGLIYNFDVQPEDTFSLFNPIVGRKRTYRVVSIDSVFIQSGYRKRYSMLSGTESSQVYEENWVEGMGCEQGPFRICTSGSVGGFTLLLCFSDGEIDYVNPKYQTCRKTTFTPKFTSLHLDTAVCGQAYRFQLTTTEVYDYDSIIFGTPWGSPYPPGLYETYFFDNQTGVLSGVFTEVGSYYFFFTIINNGIITDRLGVPFQVVDSTVVHTEHPDSEISIGIKSGGDGLTVFSGGPTTTLNTVITDMSGKVVVNKKVDSASETIRTAHLPAGIYTITIYNRKTGQLLLTEKWVR